MSVEPKNKEKERWREGEGGGGEGERREALQKNGALRIAVLLAKQIKYRD